MDPLVSASNGDGLYTKGFVSNKGWFESRLSFRNVPPLLLLLFRLRGGTTGEDPAVATEGGPADMGGLNNGTVGGFNAVATSGILDV